MAKTGSAAVVLFGLLGMTGCVVMGASSGGGFFIWPGSLGLLVLVIVVAWLMRRR
jgi:hypothetical protein